MKTKQEETDFEVRSLDTMCINESELVHPWWYNFKYAAVGVIFGIVFIKAEIISWFRIQEMFKLQSFHMYGVIGTAVVVGAISVFLIKKLKIKTVHGEEITFTNKKFNQGRPSSSTTCGRGHPLYFRRKKPSSATCGRGNPLYFRRNENRQV